MPRIIACCSASPATTWSRPPRHRGLLTGNIFTDHVGPKADTAPRRGATPMITHNLLSSSMKQWTIIQPAPKYHTKGCSRSSADSLGARTLVFAAFESFHSCKFRSSIARTPFCAILWRSPNHDAHNFWLSADTLQLLHRFVWVQASHTFPPTLEAWGSHFSSITAEAAVGLMQEAVTAAWQVRAACGRTQ